MLNQVYFEVVRPFSAEGFHKLDVSAAFKEIGYSNTEVKRMFSEGTIKVWDTRLAGDKIEWFKRRTSDFELVEAGDALIFGHPKALIIDPEPVFFLKRLFWTVRPRIERFFRK